VAYPSLHLFVGINPARCSPKTDLLIVATLCQSNPRACEDN
jgi:hypothetical protein